VHVVFYHSPVLLFFFGNIYMKLNYLRRWYYSKHIFLISEQPIFVLLIYELMYRNNEISKDITIFFYLTLIIINHPFFFNFPIRECSWRPTFTFWSNQGKTMFRKCEIIYIYIYIYIKPHVSCYPEIPSLPSNFKNIFISSTISDV
jgi:hypothetical protein